jgi:hypothetical protein
MSGLNSSRIIDQFTKDMKELEKDWSKMTPNERQNKLQISIGKSFDSASLPNIEIKLKNFPAQLQGQLDLNRLRIPRSLLRLG